MQKMLKDFVLALQEEGVVREVDSPAWLLEGAVQEHERAPQTQTESFTLSEMDQLVTSLRLRFLLPV